MEVLEGMLDNFITGRVFAVLVRVVKVGLELVEAFLQRHQLAYRAEKIVGPQGGHDDVLLLHKSEKKHVSRVDIFP